MTKPPKNLAELAALIDPEEQRLLIDSLRRSHPSYSTQAANQIGLPKPSAGWKMPKGKKLGYAMTSLATIAVITVGGCTDTAAIRQEAESKIAAAAATATQKFEEYKAVVSGRFDDINKRFNNHYTKAETDASKRVLDRRLEAAESGLRLARTQIESLERMVIAQYNGIQPSASPQNIYSAEPPKDLAYFKKDSYGNYHLVIQSNAPLSAILKNGRVIPHIVNIYEEPLTQRELRELGPDPILKFQDPTKGAIDYRGKKLKVYAASPQSTLQEPAYAMPRPLIKDQAVGIPFKNEYLINPRIK